MLPVTIVPMQLLMMELVMVQTVLVYVMDQLQRTHAVTVMVTAVLVLAVVT